MLGGQKLQGNLTALEIHKFLDARGRVDAYPLFRVVVSARSMIIIRLQLMRPLPSMRLLTKVIRPKSSPKDCNDVTGGILFLVEGRYGKHVELNRTRQRL
jgi:hypothetical protein